MALKKKGKKKKKPFIEMTLWDVILSYPDLHDPKPYKGKIYYRTDVLMDEDHAQLGELRKAIKKVKTDAWGPDKSEWPVAEKPLIGDGNNREDQTGYKDRRYITPSTQTPVPVVDLKGKTFNPQMIKGGMFANVAIRISAWEYDGDEGISIYLQGVQIDTSKASLNFGGGKSVKQMFGKDDEDENDDDDSDDDDVDSDDDDGDDEPRSSRKSKSKRSTARDESEDDDDDAEEQDDADEESSKPKTKGKAAKGKAKMKGKRVVDEDEDDDSDDDDDSEEE